MFFFLRTRKCAHDLGILVHLPDPRVLLCGRACVAGRVGAAWVDTVPRLPHMFGMKRARRQNSCECGGAGECLPAARVGIHPRRFSLSGVMEFLGRGARLASRASHRPIGPPARTASCSRAPNMHTHPLPLAGKVASQPGIRSGPSSWTLEADTGALKDLAGMHIVSGFSLVVRGCPFSLPIGWALTTRPLLP